MSPKIHIPCGVASGVAAYAVTKFLSFALTCGFANFIFDIDHCLEYARFCLQNKERPTLKRFFSGVYFDEKGTICVIFHGYEYILLLLLVTLALYFTGSSTVLISAGILTGYSEHLILDLIGNDCSIKGYSLLYRIAVRFDIHKICTKKRKK